MAVALGGHRREAMSVRVALLACAVKVGGAGGGVFEGERGRVGVGEEGKGVGRDGGMKGMGGREDPPQWVVQRHVVIAGHGKDRRRESIEKFPRGGEFGAARALR